MSQTIDIYVSAGQMSSPFYIFYTDDAGTQEFTSHLKIGTTYTFHRLNEATTHPFYISDVGYEEESTSGSITLSGDGDASSGITGTETLTLVIHEHVTNLYYYCTSHSSMISEFSVYWQPQDKDELQTAVNLWISENLIALTKYGDISTWDTSLITDMSDLFKNDTAFNHNISGWDVNSVTNFSNMFHGATAFNHDISGWDVSSGTDFTNMFTDTAGTYHNVSVNNEYPGTYWKNSNVKSVSGMVTFNVVLDLTAPVITLNGDETISHERGTAYTHAGASAVNYMSSDISSDIVVSGDVDTSVDGTYTITYNVTDPLSGLSATQVTRTVIVEEPREAIQINMNNKTYYIVNHKYMNNTSFDEFENILSYLFNETKSNMNIINDSDMTNILNSIIERYSSTGDSNGDFSQLVQTFTSDNNLYDQYVFIYEVGNNPTKYLSYRWYDGKISSSFFTTSGDDFWGWSNSTEVRDPTTNNRAYYYVFEATLKSSANVNIVDTIVI